MNEEEERKSHFAVVIRLAAASSQPGRVSAKVVFPSTKQRIDAGGYQSNILVSILLFLAKVANGSAVSARLKADHAVPNEEACGMLERLVEIWFICPEVSPAISLSTRAKAYWIAISLSPCFTIALAFFESSRLTIFTSLCGGTGERSPLDA